MTDILFRDDLPTTYIMHMGDDLSIARAAWEDWDREFKSIEHAEAFFDKIIGEHHGSPIEFSEIVFHCEVPLFTATQLLRHRTMSFAGRSGRYKAMLPHFYLPPRERPTKLGGKSKMNPTFVHQDDHEWHESRHIRMCNSESCWTTYQRQLELGEAEEVARMDLPGNTYTGYSFKADLRNIFGFLQLRIDHPANLWPTHPQWEIAQVALQVDEVVQRLWPISYAKFTKYGRIKP